MLRIGVLGAAHLGKIHIKLIKEIKNYELAWIFDPDQENAAFAEKEYGIKAYSDIDALIDACDVIDIVTPTLSHYDCAVQAMTPLVSDLKADVVTFQMASLDQPALIEMLGRDVLPKLRALAG